ncbi:MAG: arylesterase [Bdellovibrionota bacterium]|nr:arylesterase [Bdellovibrionota bacterium]
MTKILSLFAIILSMQLFAADQAPKKLVIIGDSITEGYGLSKEKAYPAVLEKMIQKNGHNYKVINGGISGSTTSSAMSRLTWFLRSKPDMIILALGANDGLRGIKVDVSKANLEKFIEKCQQEKVKVVIAGMQVPPNYGEEYGKAFRQMYKDIISKYKIPSIPFLIEGVAGKAELNIEDGIHPNEKGHEIVAQNVYKHIKELL